MESIEATIDEIKQIRIQYEAEVGSSGRKAWPRSIKDRVAKLFETGMKGVAVAERTGLSYFTVLKWRPRQRPRGKNAFRELAILAKDAAPRPVASSRRSTQIATVTLPHNAQPATLTQKVVTVTMTSPDGFRWDFFDQQTVIEVIRQLRQGRE